MDNAEKQKILEELGGIPVEFYDELVHDFMAQARTQIQTINEALKNGDFSTASKTAHSVKGSSGNLRIYAIQKLAQFIELESKENGDMNSLQEHARMLENALNDFEKDFK